MIFRASRSLLQTRLCFWVWYAAGLSSSAVSTVHAADRRISFVNDVVPTLTKAGCNTGVCHAKAGGQNGFQLSLLGFEPAEDFEHIVPASRGRRCRAEESRPEPVASQALRRSVPRRRSAAAEGFRRLRHSSATGFAKARSRTTRRRPKLVAMEIEPKRAALPRQATQQLKAIARYSDGSVARRHQPGAVRVERQGDGRGVGRTAWSRCSTCPARCP